MGGEKSYEPVVPVKVENRRAPARGGHDIHWREGANRWTYRFGTTYPRRRTRIGMSNGTGSTSCSGQGRMPGLDR